MWHTGEATLEIRLSHVLVVAHVLVVGEALHLRAAMLAAFDEPHLVTPENFLRHQHHVVRGENELRPRIRGACGQMMLEQRRGEQRVHAAVKFIDDVNLPALR